jgi:hypothetical protein
MNADDPRVQPHSVFNFTDFAREIYYENSEVREEKFLLPALYGGNLADGEGRGKFKALVVLQNPLFTFTRERWRTQCATPEDAVERHREIFFQWWRLRQNPELTELFRIFVDKPSTAEEFFQRVYVTDIWKDAKDTEDVISRKKDREYGHYWRSKLAIEIKGVAAATERVIFVGAQARSGFQFVPVGTRARCVVFPDWGHKKTFAAEFQQLIADIHSGMF